LIQDAAYQSLLKSTRQRYHRQIAQVLEAQFPDTAAAQPELLAQHYTEAGLQEEAIPYWHKAGQRAIQRTANLEAIAHLTRGLELLALLPDTPQWVQQELGFQTTLGPALMATKGYAAPEVAKTFARARELCQQLGETPQTFVVLRGLWGFYTVRGALQTARELGEQLLRLAQTVQDPALLLEAHYGLGATFFYLGEFTLAREHSEQGMVYYDPQKRRSHSALQDPGVACLSYTAWALWYLGYPEQALNRSSEALTLARELAHPISGAWAMDFAAMLHQHRREGQAAQERAEAAITICTEQDFAFWLVVGTILQGWALAEQGQVAEGAVQMQQGIAAWRATGSELARPYFLALLAETLGQGGQPQTGLAALAEAVALADRTLDRFHAAELYRLQGELTLQQGGVPNFHAVVEASFWQAIDVARTQQAKSLELRAATSLARLWQQQGKCTEAYDLLAHVYGWFTEGFDTADLQEAKALLETLV
jgi:predicted ATPase